MRDIPDILERWNVFCETIECSIDTREFNQVRRSFNEGCGCFEEIKVYIQARKESELSQFKSQIDQTIQRWHGLTDRIKPWMNEIEAQMKSLSGARIQRNKIDKKYRFHSPKALNVKMKAR